MLLGLTMDTIHFCPIFLGSYTYKMNDPIPYTMCRNITEYNFGLLLFCAAKLRVVLNLVLHFDGLSVSINNFVLYLFSFFPTQ